MGERETENTAITTPKTKARMTRTMTRTTTLMAETTTTTTPETPRATTTTTTLSILSDGNNEWGDLVAPI